MVPDLVIADVEELVEDCLGEFLWGMNIKCMLVGEEVLGEETAINLHLSRIGTDWCDWERHLRSLINSRGNKVILKGSPFAI